MRFWSLVAGLCLFLVGCDGASMDDEPVPYDARGTLIEDTRAVAYSSAELAVEFARQGSPIVPRFGADVYWIAYWTIDVHGDPIRATGALSVPNPALHEFDLLSYQHGTSIRKTAVPSYDSEELGIGLLMAGDGYMVPMPDLVGLGDSPGLHPYLIASVSATAVVDMLRAVRALAAREGWMLSGDVMLTGYSQGGYTAMAAHRAIEAEYASEFTVRASTPMAGAYDLSGTMYELMIKAEPYPEPYYLPYVLFAYNEAYRIYESYSDYLASPYDETLPPLFDGLHGSSEINALMPAEPINILRPDVLADMKARADHPFRVRLRENDLTDWTPRAPVRMYHCSGDVHVPIENTQVAAAGLAGGSAEVTWVDPSPGADHGGCVLPSLLAARAWLNAR